MSKSCSVINDQEDLRRRHLAGSLGVVTEPMRASFKSAGLAVVSVPELLRVTCDPYSPTMVSLTVVRTENPEISMGPCTVGPLRLHVRLGRKYRATTAVWGHPVGRGRKSPTRWLLLGTRNHACEIKDCEEIWIWLLSLAFDMDGLVDPYFEVIGNCAVRFLGDLLERRLDRYRRTHRGAKRKSREHNTHSCRHW